VYGEFVKMLSIIVLELIEMRVGLLIRGRKEDANIVSMKSAVGVWVE
jgi:hypothetical protein